MSCSMGGNSRPLRCARWPRPLQDWSNTRAGRDESKQVMVPGAEQPLSRCYVPQPSGKHLLELLGGPREGRGWPGRERVSASSGAGAVGQKPN